MKTLILMRHGRTQEHSAEGDKGRALTDRGEQDAQAMGKRITARAGAPGFVVTSDATRARETAALAARGAGYRGEVHRDPAIYDAEWEDVLGVVQALPDAADIVLLVGHNPGLPILAAHLLAPPAAAPALPPAGAIILHLDIDRWAEAGSGSASTSVVLAPN